MWFGVRGGLRNYDGYDWTEFELPEAYAGYAINHVMPTADGNVFVGTDRALLLLSEGRWRKVFPLTATERVDVSDLAVLPDGSLLAGLRATGRTGNVAGLLRVRADDLLLYASAYTLATLSDTTRAGLQLAEVPDAQTVGVRDERVMSVQDLLLGRQDQLFVAISEAEGLGKIAAYGYDRGISDELRVRTVYSAKDGLRIRKEVSMAETEAGELWVVSKAHDLGVQHFDGKRWTSVRLSETFGGVNSQSSVMACSDGTVWVDGHGRFFRLRKGAWSKYEYPNVYLSTSSSFNFFEAADKSIWVLGFMNDVFRFDNTFATWATYHDLNFQQETGDGSTWFTGARGEVIRERFGEWTAYGPDDGLMNVPVRVYTTSYGETWAVGSHRGVAATAYLTDGGWRMTLHPLVSWGIDYRAVYEDRGGSLWFGCSVDIQPTAGHRGGVLELPDPSTNKTKWVHHTGSPNGYLTNCYGIGQSADGLLWFGGQQLHHYEAGEWSAAEERDWLSGYIDAVQNVPDGKVWFGTRHHGIAVYDGQHWTQHTTDSGLSSNNIISIDAGGPDEVWVATYGGVCHYDGRQWTDNLFPRSLILSPESTRLRYGSSGLLWFNRSSIDWRRRGLMWPDIPESVYQGHRTVVYNQGEHPPRTHILNAPEEVDEAGNLTVFWTGNDYYEQTPLDELQFSYRINDGAWSDFTHQQYRRFEELPAGNYRIAVRARDRDFNVDPSPAVHTFRVLAPWWWRPQFVVLAALALVTIGVLQYLVLRHYQHLKVLNGELEDKSRQLRQQNLLVQDQKAKLEHNLTEIREVSESRLRFFTNVSHEFRTPLSLIIGPIDELIEEADDIGHSKRDKYYTIIRRNGQRILRLIDQILQIYKVEESTLAYRPLGADLSEYVREITDQFSTLAQQRSVELVVDVPPTPLPVRFDQDKVEKILFNLLSNAFKNVAAGGSIRVITELTGEPEARRLKLAVVDDGRGIPAASLPRVFERFYQAPNAQATTSHLGVGIGLSYIKELVRTHGGDISVDSTPGVATTFTVYLPYEPVDRPEERAAGEGTAAHPSAEMHFALEELRVSLDPLPGEEPTAVLESGSNAPARRRKLLIVEDDLDTRLFLRTCFESRCTVIEATDGQEGFTLAKSEYPDLIISDVTMPVMDGVDLCSALKSDFDTSHIPVILLTARTLEEEKIRGFRVGADAYVEKPFSYRILESRVAALVRSRELLRQHFQGSGELDITGAQFASVDETFLQDAIRVIEEEIDNSGLNAQEISRKLGVSRIQLYRKLKALTGQTVSNFVRSVRLKHAARLLLERRLTISEIAYRTGFTAPNHFSTYFKAHYQVSPSEYQRKHGKQGTSA